MNVIELQGAPQSFTCYAVLRQPTLTYEHTVSVVTPSVGQFVSIYMPMQAV